MAVWYSLWSLGIAFPIWYVWSKRNLATLLSSKPLHLLDAGRSESQYRTVFFLFIAKAIICNNQEQQDLLAALIGFCCCITRLGCQAHKSCRPTKQNKSGSLFNYIFFRGVSAGPIPGQCLLSNTGLPDFSWCKIPKGQKYTK
jgi:hypothetical protein